MLTHETEPHVV